MAGYLSPGAYFYTEEQEYLQAYEDVLERYKGPSPKVACAGLLWQEMPHVEQNKSKLLFKRTKNISPRDFLWDVLSHPLHRIAEQ